MKRIIAILMVLLCCSSACALTVEDIETQIGIDFESADADFLKFFLQGYDAEMTKQLSWYDDLKQICYKRLIELGESEWVTKFSGFDQTDLATMSYSNLIHLKNQINLAIWNSQEWQEVTVPIGTWQVGVHIPAGHWTVKAHPESWATNISWGERLKENGEDISYYGRNSTSNTVYNPNSETFNPIKEISEYSFEVQDGDYIKIMYGAAIFMPYIGTEITFGFK